MKDFSCWMEYIGTSEGGGRSEKKWLIEPITNQTGLFKYKKDFYTTDHISECIAYQLACLLEIECAKYELGIYNGREGSMSYNIIQNKKNIEFKEGINLINILYPNFNVEILQDIPSGKIYSLEMIKESLNDYIMFLEFLRIPIFDYLIGNTDRHQSNWGIHIENGYKKTLCPIYDNSSSLCAYIPEEKIQDYLGKDKLKWNALVNTKSKSIIRRTVYDNRKVTHDEMMRYIVKFYYCETQEFVETIIKKMTKKNICDILNSYSNNLLSNNKKNIICKFLLYKVDNIRTLYKMKEK